jgi:hypothetical protein
MTRRDLSAVISLNFLCFVRTGFRYLIFFTSSISFFFFIFPFSSAVGLDFEGNTKGLYRQKSKLSRNFRQIASPKILKRGGHLPGSRPSGTRRTIREFLKKMLQRTASYSQKQRRHWNNRIRQKTSDRIYKIFWFSFVCNGNEPSQKKEKVQSID